MRDGREDRERPKNGNQSRLYCFYCNATLSKDYEEDHFPVPKECGGKITVPTCFSCHDMKDRIQLHKWPAAWWATVMADFPKVSRETRIFLAKAARLVQMANKDRAKREEAYAAARLQV